MDKKSINKALKRYYDGESSIEEEEQLFDVMNQDDLDEEFSLEKDQFNFFQQERNIKLSENFEDRLEEIISHEDKGYLLRFNYTKTWISIAAALIITVGLSWWFYGSNNIIWHEEISLNSTTKEVLLPDASIIYLNKNSQVNFPEKFGEKREISFQGEGFFEITPDTEKPFLIHTENSLIQVLGTSFNVRNYAEEATVVVTVVSGKVAFSSIQNELQEKVFLLKGEQAIYNKSSNRIQKSIQKLNDIAWKTKNLTFSDDPMRDVIQDLEEYFEIDIEVEDKSILNCRFKGHFQNASMETILNVLEYGMGISHEFSKEQYILSGQGCNN